METPAAHTLRKAERLCGKKDISRLFSEGKWGVGAHLRYCWVIRAEGSPAPRNDGGGICSACSAAAQDMTPDSVRREGDASPNRLLVSVPKRYFKRAVKRNLLKRRMREAYRLQKELLGCRGVDFLLSWTSKEVGDWETVRDEVATALTRISKAVAKQRAMSDGNAAQPAKGRLTEAGADGASHLSTERVPACPEDSNAKQRIGLCAETDSAE